MKKLILVGFLALTTLFASAQDGLKGTWFTGGTLSLGSATTYDGGDKIKTDTYEVMPLLGTFIAPTVAIGGALGYSHSKVDGLKTNIFTVMPLARKYWNITGNLYAFGQAALPVGFGNTKIGDAKINHFGIHAQLSPGFDLIVNKWLTIEASFVLLNAGYTSSKPKGGDKSDSWSINGNSISSSSFGDLSVGVKFLF